MLLISIKLFSVVAEELCEDAKEEESAVTTATNNELITEVTTEEVLETTESTPEATTWVIEFEPAVQPQSEDEEDRFQISFEDYNDYLQTRLDLQPPSWMMKK